MTYLLSCIILISSFLHVIRSEDTDLLFAKMWECPTAIRDVRDKLVNGTVFVPVIGRNSNFLAIRYSMFCKGLYPGVEYIITDISVRGRKNISSIENNLKRPNKPLSKDLNLNLEDMIVETDVELTVKPAYPLIPELEREWPVVTKLEEIPYVVTKGMYNSLTVLASSSLAFSCLFLAFIVSQIITFSVVNSRSMIPTIQPKDIILVEKVSPFLTRDILKLPYKSDDIIFFAEPEVLKNYIKENHIPPIQSGSLLVKRVKNEGLIDHFITVRGDNPEFSLDSRQFGCFPSKDVVGRPLFRIWPLNRIGLVNKVQIIK